MSKNAVTGVSPWKSLKALANQQKPVLQLVLPDEVAQKPLAKQPAAKGSKQAKPMTMMPTRPADLDPTKLLLDAGAFRTGEDEPLNQIPSASLGPLAKGVALMTFAEAQPFLQAGKILTHQGFGSDCDQSPR